MRGLALRVPELDIPRLARGAGYGGRNRKKEGVVEGFRVLTLLYRVSELPPSAFQRLVELFRAYRAVAALHFWSKRLNLEEGVELALERTRQLPSYYRHAFDERSQVYQFSEVEKMRRPRKIVLKQPLVDALHPNHGCYIKDGMLVVRLGNGERLELPLPERALEWLQEKEREVAPLKVTKTVRVQWREDKPEHLRVQIVLRVERQKPVMPDPKGALLAYVDANSDYGIVAVYAVFDGSETKVLETPKLRPPNRSRRLMEAARRRRAAARGRKLNVNYALARLSERFDSRGWVKAAAAQIFKKAFKRASGRSVVMNFDIPDPESIKESYLQKTLLSLRKVADNLAKWFGVYTTFECYPSTVCPCCGSELEMVYTRRTRVAYCRNCGFYDDRDFVPFYHWCKALGLPMPKHPLQRIELPEELKPLINTVRPESPRGWAASWRGRASARCPAARARAGHTQKAPG
jgi:transposase